MCEPLLYRPTCTKNVWVAWGPDPTIYEGLVPDLRMGLVLFGPGTTMEREYYWLIPCMPLILSIDLQLYGAYEFNGPDAHISYLTPIGGYASLLLQGSSEVMLSKEGVAQGDPFSMLMNANGPKISTLMIQPALPNFQT